MFRIMMMVMKFCSKEYRFLNPITTNPTPPKLPKKMINFSISLNPNYITSLEISPKFSKAKKLDKTNKEIIDNDIDASSSIRKPLGSTLWPGTYPSPVTNALREARSSTLTAAGSTTLEEEEEEEQTISRQDKSKIFQEQYRDPSIVGVRFGKLLEDLDALGGTISFKSQVSRPSSYQI
ncbi:hypothetical protein MKX01_011929 [Papaver californicum]|nr:hypothetical protein MKX01_011929 [Papaver californicum]